MGPQTQIEDRDYMKMQITGHSDRMVVDAPEETDDTKDATHWTNW